MPIESRSLVPGSSNPFDRTVPVSIRYDNCGVINDAAWEKSYSGQIDTVKTRPGNNTTSIWWELLRRYAAGGATTVTFKGQTSTEMKSALLQVKALPLAPGNDVTGKIVCAKPAGDL